MLPLLMSTKIIPLPSAFWAFRTWCFTFLVMFCPSSTCIFLSPSIWQLQLCKYHKHMINVAYICKWKVEHASLRQLFFYFVILLFIPTVIIGVIWNLSSLTFEFLLFEMMVLANVASSLRIHTLCNHFSFVLPHTLLAKFSSTSLAFEIFLSPIWAFPCYQIAFLSV